MKTTLGTLVLLAVGALAFGQGNTGTLSGIVQDPTGAAVPAASVTVTATATGQIVKTVTNDKGEYALPSMSAGVYRVSVSKPGFKIETVDGVEMNAGVAQTVNIRLE